ncbi:MAG: septum formation protein Maf [Bacteroidia bacterium]|jgi:septum formation protein|nr:septum formation protein Maf [Bacteroidia bacterium]
MKKLILASQSQRRRQLLEEAGLAYTLLIRDTDESYPATLKCEEIARYVAERKAEAFGENDIPDDTVLITADTIVWLPGKGNGSGNEGTALFKPKDKDDAIAMLGKLSGRMHTVATGVCLRSKAKRKVFHVLTNVFFKPLSLEERSYYVKNFEPYDKSGSYGIQEWIGVIGIERIEGSYTNVMGLPIKELYEELVAWKE